MSDGLNNGHARCVDWLYRSSAGHEIGVVTPVGIALPMTLSAESPSGVETFHFVRMAERVEEATR